MKSLTPWRWVDRVSRDVRYAARSLRRTPLFAAVVVGVVALGIGANAATLSVLHQLFTRHPSGVAAPEQLRFLYVDGRADNEPGRTYTISRFYYPPYIAIRDANPNTPVAAFTWDDVRLRRGEDVASVQATWASPEYFSVVRVGAVLGRVFGPDEARIDAPSPVAILSHDFWKRQFGMDSAVIGRSIVLERTRYTIVGVAAPEFSGLVLEPSEVFLPLNTYPGRGEEGKPWYQSDNVRVYAIARIARTDSLRTIVDRFTQAYKGFGPGGFAADSISAIRVAALNEARVPGAMEREVSISWRVAGVSLLLFLIACANIATLLLVRATKQGREIAVRMALGASRAQIFSRLLTESAVLAIAGGMVAILVAWWGGRTLRTLLLPSIDWSGNPIDARVVIAIAVMCAVVAVVGSIAPVVMARRRAVIDAMKGTAGSSTGHRSRVRAGLIVVQTALSVVLIAGATLFVKSLGNVRSIRTGYAVDSLLTVAPGFFPTPGQRTELDAGLRALRARMVQQPGVIAAAFGSGSPMGSWTAIGLKLPGRDSVPRLAGGNPDPMLNWVSPEYFDVVGMRMVEGRAFTERDGGVLVVNELMAKTFWPGESALGQCVIVGLSCSYVVGVTENAHRMRILEDPTMNYYLPARDALSLTLRVDPRQRVQIIAQLRKEVASRFPQFDDMSVGTLSERLARELRPWRLGASIFVAFALLAIFVAAIGVYSVIAYGVSLRTREMGVRTAMGARAVDLIKLVVGGGLRIVAIGAVVGIGATLALGKLVASVLYGVTPTDPASIALAAVSFLCVGALAASVPAWRASRVDPGTVLRSD